MSRRTKQLFSLSLLDLLTSALGAIIFLFIITPKGGASASESRQAMVYFDTTLMKIHGDLPDSLLGKMAGDTMQVVLLAYEEDPEAEATARAEAEKRKAALAREKAEKARAVAEAEARAKALALEKAKEKQKAQPKPPANKPTPSPEPTKQPEPKPEPKPNPKPASKPSYTGSGPSVPANVSFEVNWQDKGDNIDLFICKDGDCVYGGRKKNKSIGQWDSGKSRNRLFGNDLRTNQEAVRQFDEIIPGEYKIYAQFKDSDANRSEVLVKGLIYTKDVETGKERGENFSRTLELGKGRIHIATIILKEDGSYSMKRP